jgi:hypothetical protein
LGEAADQAGIATATLKRARRQLHEDGIIDTRKIGNAWYIYRLKMGL